MRFLITFFAVSLAAPLGAVEIATPDGRDVTLFDVVLETDVARFRFLFPPIALGVDGVTFPEMLDDIQYLCDSVALPGLQASDWNGAEIVISISSAALEFGEIAPEITQFFQPFSIQTDTCIWEDF